MKLKKLKEGNRVIFNDRAQPLKVKETGKNFIYVEGPKGGEYEIYRDGDTLLVCKKDTRRYSSYCKNLRKVGEWIKEGNKWHHSISGAEVRIKKDENGFWRVKSDTFEVENPKYGFSSKEFAKEEAEKILAKNPDGNT